MSGGKLFLAEARIVILDDLSVAGLRDYLETITGDIMIDIDLSASNTLINRRCRQSIWK